MQVVSAEPSELFVGPPDAPLQLVRVTVSGCARADADPGGRRRRERGGRSLGAQVGQEIVEVPVAVQRPVVGERRAARVHAGGVATPFDFTVAEPGWTMFMVSHFHYDPVWWNTQGAYTSEWVEDPPGRARQANGFELVHAHLEMARRDPDYKFVLAEVDYLKPYWDTRPEDRADLRRFLAQGRVEVMGGTYNEPNTNLTSPETTIRNLVHGMGFQRDVLGADSGHRVAARRVRPRPAISRAGGRRRPDVQFVGPRPAPPVGSGFRRWGRRSHAVLQRVRVDRAVGPGPAHPLHARALFGRLVDGLVGLAGRGRGAPPSRCSINSRRSR